MYNLCSKNENYLNKSFVNIYCNNPPPESTCREWFRRFKNHDSYVKDKERKGTSKRFEQRLK